MARKHFNEHCCMCPHRKYIKHSINATIAGAQTLAHVCNQCKRVSTHTLTDPNQLIIKQYYESFDCLWQTCPHVAWATPAGAVPVKPQATPTILPFSPITPYSPSSFHTLISLLLGTRARSSSQRMVEEAKDSGCCCSQRNEGSSSWMRACRPPVGQPTSM